MIDFYETVYRVIGEKPKSVLVLAAGMGNDLAVAIRHGANYIDAVEIDPKIVELGRKLHPERPYDNPCVHVTVDDARAFLHRTEKKYDLVEYCLLDSHAAFSAMSSIRLDNYVYTVESFRDAEKILKPHGVIAVTQFVTQRWQLCRLFKTLTEALGREPVGVISPNENAVTFFFRR